MTTHFGHCLDALHTLCPHVGAWGAVCSCDCHHDPTGTAGDELERGHL